MIWVPRTMPPKPGPGARDTFFPAAGAAKEIPPISSDMRSAMLSALVSRGLGAGWQYLCVSERMQGQCSYMHVDDRLHFSLSMRETIAAAYVLNLVLNLVVLYTAVLY